MVERGRLVCMMGIDGSGKTTQAKLLCDELEASGITATYVWNRWEPWLLASVSRTIRPRGGGSPGSTTGVVADRKRRLMSNPVLRQCWIWASLADYAAQAHSRMTKALAAADVVVCDRYLPDYVVDQMINTGDPAWTIRRVFGSRLSAAFPVPDVVLLVDVPAEVAFQRKDDGVPVELLEVKAAAYRDVARALGAATVPAIGTEGSVARHVTRLVRLEQDGWRVENARGARRRGWPRS